MGRMSLKVYHNEMYSRTPVNGIVYFALFSFIFKLLMIVDGRTVRETHEKLKVGDKNKINCYYAHAEQPEGLQRRCYWILDKTYDDVVLVHYICSSTSRVAPKHATGGSVTGINSGSSPFVSNSVLKRPQRAAAAKARLSNYLDSENDEENDNAVDSGQKAKTGESSDADYNILEDLDSEEDDSGVGHVVPVQPVLMEKKKIEELREDSFLKLIGNVHSLNETSSSIIGMNLAESLRPSLNIPLSPGAHDPGLLLVSPHQAQTLAQANTNSLHLNKSLTAFDREDQAHTSNGAQQGHLYPIQLSGSQGILLKQISIGGGLTLSNSLSEIEIDNWLESPLQLLAGDPTGSHPKINVNDVNSMQSGAGVKDQSTVVGLNGNNNNQNLSWSDGNNFNPSLRETELLLSSGVAFPGRLSSHSFSFMKDMSLDLGLQANTDNFDQSLGENSKGRSKNNGTENKFRSTFSKGIKEASPRADLRTEKQVPSSSVKKVETLRSVRAPGFRSQRGSTPNLGDEVSRLSSASPENSFNPDQTVHINPSRRKNPTSVVTSSGKMERIANSVAAAAAVADEKREEILQQFRRAKVEASAFKNEEAKAEEVSGLDKIIMNETQADDEAELIENPNQLIRFPSHMLGLPLRMQGSSIDTNDYGHANQATSENADEARTRTLLKNMSIDHERAEEARSAAAAAAAKLQ